MHRLISVYVGHIYYKGQILFGVAQIIFCMSLLFNVMKITTSVFATNLQHNVLYGLSEIFLFQAPEASSQGLIGVTNPARLIKVKVFK